jgi:serine/threonine protein kinase
MCCCCGGGGYEIRRVLGEGNFSKVKYVRHSATGGHFALKILDRSKILSQQINDQVIISLTVHFPDICTEEQTATSMLNLPSLIQGISIFSVKNLDPFPLGYNIPPPAQSLLR